MKILTGVAKFISLTVVFLLVKLLSNLCSDIAIFSLSIFIESCLVFILNVVYVFNFDAKQKPFKEKGINALIISAGYFIIFIIFGILKNVINNYLVSVFANFVLFALMGALPLIRDKFLYNAQLKRELKLNKILIIYFVVAKLVLNLCYYLCIERQKIDAPYFSYILVFAFVLFLYVTKSVVYNKLLSGYIEFDGIEYPVFDTMKVGKSKSCDIVIEDDKGSKSVCFSIDVSKKGWTVKTNSDVYLENSLITRSALAESGDTIKYNGNYFTTIISKGNIIKRSLLFFFFILSAFCCFGQNILDKSMSSNDKLSILNINYDNYPTIDFYFYDNTIQENLTNNHSFNQKDFFILEDEKVPVDFKDITSKYRPLDLALVLDITGSLQDEYIRLEQTILDICASISKNRESLRVGLITFADRPEEMTFINMSSDYQNVISNIKTIPSQSGEDYEENSFEALMKVRDFTFNDNAQKIVLLVTDAPPHIKGDKSNKGRDYTNYSVDDITKFFASSSYLLYVVTYSRFDVYHDITKSDSDIFDIASYNDLSGILNDLQKVINNQIKISYTARKRKSFYSKNSTYSKTRVIAFKDLDARKAKDFYNQQKLRKNSFVNSLFDGF